MTITLTKEYKPRGSACEVFSHREPEVLVAGPMGTGKSRACLEKLNAAAFKYPKMRGLICRQVATSLTNTALQTFREWVIPELLESGAITWYGGSAQEPAQYRYQNGSSIHVGGLDRPSKIMSAEYDFIYVQEATETTENGWELLGTRLRNGVMPYQQLLGDCNPDADTHFLYQRYLKGLLVKLDSAHWENPRLFTEDGKLTFEGVTYMLRLESLTGVRRKRNLGGLWVGTEGQIWDEWDPAIHVLESMPSGWEYWPRYWSIDFGFRVFTLQCWAEDPDGRLYLYREIYQSEILVEDAAKLILSLVTDKDGNWTEPHPQVVLADHDAEGRATFEKHSHLGTTKAKKDVLDGLEAVAKRLRLDADGRPRLFIYKNALVQRDQKLLDKKLKTSVVEEIPAYIWATGSKEEPKKDQDHGCDAMRYMTAYRDLVSMVRFRRL